MAVALQIGVNYANDYSDGIRGTDSSRIGPLRLVGSGTVALETVRAAAFAAFAVASVAGIALVVLTGSWWLLGVGGLALAAAWFYTGGRRPYGYHGLGELSVFVFFGLVAAVIGTTYVQVGRVTPASVVSGIAIGCLACAILVANNLRDMAGDARRKAHARRLRLPPDPAAVCGAVDGSLLARARGGCRRAGLGRPRLALVPGCRPRRPSGSARDQWPRTPAGVEGQCADRTVLRGSARATAVSGS